MSNATSIEWTQATWNPVTGCSKVSPGCTNCYAERMSLRFGWSQYPWSAAHAEENVVLHPNRLGIPLRWRKPRLVFVNSMSDLFHERVPLEFISKVWATMSLTPRHQYQILTKRPERMAEAVASLAERHRPPDGSRWPLPNVWLGTSVEDQRRADERILHLLRCPAAVRFLSCEPLLGPVEIRGPIESCRDCDPCIGGHPEQCAVGSWRSDVMQPDGIRWVIAGGESGPGARPAHPDWFRSLRDQCQAAVVPFFFKQWGVYRPVEPGEPSYGPGCVCVEENGDRDEWHDGTVCYAYESTGAVMRRTGKKSAGAVLDGHEWRQMPVPTGTGAHS